MQRRSKRHFHRCFIFLRHADQLGNYALHTLLQFKIASAVTEYVAHARVIALVRALHFLQHLQAGFSRLHLLLHRTHSLARFAQALVCFIQRCDGCRPLRLACRARRFYRVKLCLRLRMFRMQLFRFLL